MRNPKSLPRHVQISEMLMREIEAGILLDGERLPGEREMAANLHIAVGTLRKALAILTERGVLERIHGSGNYVRRNPDTDHIYRFFHLEKRSGGGLPTAQLISVKRMRKPATLPPFGTATDAIRIRRIRALNGTPAAIEEIWLDGDRAGQIAKSDLSESVYQYYKKHLNFWIGRIEEKVSVAPPPGWGTALMDDTGPEIWGHVERLSWDNQGDTVEYSETWFHPERAHYAARWN